METIVAHTQAGALSGSCAEFLFFAWATAQPAYLRPPLHVGPFAFRLRHLIQTRALQDVCSICIKIAVLPFTEPVLEPECGQP
jgi:hypothetical protein